MFQINNASKLFSCYITSEIIFNIIPLSCLRGLTNVYEMRARKHIFMDAQNSLIVDMEAVRTIIKMKQIGLIGVKMTMQVLVLQKMVLNMGSILKLST
jgi:hypothetical protein